MGREGAFTEAGPGVTRREGSVLQVNIKASSLSVPVSMSVPRAEGKELGEFMGGVFVLAKSRSRIKHQRKEEPDE
jgi:hypothetical protein